MPLVLRASRAQTLKGKNNFMEKYNGYSNDFTWIVALHLNNNERLHESVKEIERTEDLAEIVCDMISDKHDNKSAEENSMQHDLITYALTQVDWSQVLEAIKQR